MDKKRSLFMNIIVFLLKKIIFILNFSILMSSNLKWKTTFTVSVHSLQKSAK